MNGGGQDLFRSQGLQERTHRRHIRHGVQGPHLVEVDQIHRLLMDLAFGLGNAVIHGQGLVLHPPGGIQPLDDVADVHHGVVGMMMPLPFFLTVDRHRHMGAGDPQLLALLRLKADTGDGQPIQLLEHPLPVRAELQQSCRQHIPGGAHG